MRHETPRGARIEAAARFDPVGNRELPSDSTFYGYDANNRMTQGPALYGYDADGNQTSALTLPQVAGANERTSTYDVGSRPTQIVDHAAGSPASSDTIHQYAHDRLGRRIRATRKAGGSTTNTYYLWNGDRIVAEFGDAGTRVYQYLPGDYSPVFANIDNDWYGVHADHLDTPRLLTDASGAVAWRGPSTAFGDNFGAGQSNAVEFGIRFPGQIRDASGLYYNRFRDYDPSVGRYVEADPIGLSGGENVYVYAEDSPLVMVDLFGLTPSDRECCAYAVGQVRSDAEGTVACCNGRKILCTWDPEGGSPPRSIINACRRKHEMSHMGDGICDQGCPAMMRVPDRPASECTAYGVEVDCLTAKKWKECGTDRACRTRIELEIADRRTHEKFECALSTGPK